MTTHQYPIGGNDFREYIGQLVSGGHLEGAALGIAKLVVDKGVDALSEKQRYVIQEHILGNYAVPECKRCGGNIPWSEMYEAHDNGGLCSWCDHMTKKAD